MTKYAGADWLEQHYWERRKVTPSRTGRLAAEVLGQVYQGVYHVSSQVTSSRINWESDEVKVFGFIDDLSTYDAPRLTLLILCCMAAKLDVRVKAVGKSYHLTFTPAINPLDPMELVGEKIGIHDHDFYRDLPVHHAVDYMQGYPRPALRLTGQVMKMNHLITLVQRSHGSLVRVEISHHRANWLSVFLTQRGAEGRIHERHPDMQAAISGYRHIWGYLLDLP